MGSESSTSGRGLSSRQPFAHQIDQPESIGRSYSGRRSSVVSPSTSHGSRWSRGWNTRAGRRPARRFGGCPGRMHQCSTSKLMVVTARFSAPRLLALAIEWANLHQGELLRNWNRIGSDQAPRRIAPLE
jgi:hypothetical protein